MEKHYKRTLYCGRKTLELDRPAVMGIVNLTPDSFSGDGVGADISAALRYAEVQIAAGADILDLGAESSRPGAQPLSLSDELARLLPVLQGLRDCSLPVSVDTYKPEVMRAALDSGADIINDIYALRRPGAIDAIVNAQCAVCLMHMQGEPLNMQAAPEYQDVVGDVERFLKDQASQALEAGISAERIWIDPGFGFGKSLSHNIALFRHIKRFADSGYPVLVGVSRKSMLGTITGRRVDARDSASVVAATLAAKSGASILRVHDVAATLDGLRVLNALGEYS